MTAFLAESRLSPHSRPYGVLADVTARLRPTVGRKTQ
jgi:hypothetical protein